MVVDRVTHPTETPVETLARFLHPRDRIVSRLGPEHTRRVRAAFSLVVTLVVVVARHDDGSRSVAVTTDLLAGELVAVARGGGAADDDVVLDRPGAAQPWEDSTIQAATALGLGVDHPSRLVLLDATGDWSSTTPGTTRGPEAAGELASRLGMAPGQVIRVTRPTAPGAALDESPG